MTITVYGAGAIGGVTGAALAEAGHDLLLVDRAEDHVAAMNARGLTIERSACATTVPVRAAMPDALGHGLELVLLAVKSQDTPGALSVLDRFSGHLNNDRLEADYMWHDLDRDVLTQQSCVFERLTPSGA